MRYIVFLFCLFCIIPLSSYAQQIPAIYQEQAREELKKRGLEEAEVRQRLLAKGIDIDNITVDQLPQFQGTIEAIITELEAEKNTTNNDTDLENTLLSEKPTGQALPEKMESSPPITTNEAPSEEMSLVISENESTTTDTKRRGLDFFSNNLSKETANQVSENIPNFYILSTGDELTISIFGASQYDARFQIGPSGYIKPSKLPKIFLKGLTYIKAKELLRNRFDEFYTFNKEQFAVSLTNPRLVRVNIFGEVNKYGTVSLTGANTALNALEIAGGVNEIGSVRNINLIRGDDKIAVDIYAFMKDPTVQFQYYLEDGDIIHVPVVDRLITIAGAVRRPMIYELKEQEHLLEIIEFAGGLLPTAYKKNIQIERIENDEKRILDIDLQALLQANKDYPLQSGDKVIIRSIQEDQENYVNISGAVEMAGSYSLDNTPRISDLLAKGVLKREAHLEEAFLTRENLDGTSQLIELDLNEILANKQQAVDLLLERKDRLEVYLKKQFTDAATITVKGAVRNSSLQHPYSANTPITVTQAILLAGGLRQDAYTYGYISRSNPESPDEKEYLPINIKKAVATPSSSDNLLLAPYDELTILSNSTFRDEARVSISGAIRKPNSFQYHESLTLKDVFTLSGGFSFGAALNRIDIFRLVMEENKPTKTIVSTLQVDSLFRNINGLPINVALQPFDEIVVRSIPEFELQRFVQVEGEVTYPGRYALLEDNEPISSLIKRAGGLTLEAAPAAANLFRQEEEEILLVTQLEEVLKNNASKYNYILQQGDRLVIPKRKEVIAINIKNTRASDAYPTEYLAGKKINVAYDKGKRANWYIKEYAVGFGTNASRKSVYVKYPNGELKRTKNFLLFNQYPIVLKGSTITVGAKPPKKDKAKKDKDPVNWERVIATTFQAISLGVTTILLVQRL